MKQSDMSKRNHWNLKIGNEANPCNAEVRDASGGLIVLRAAVNDDDERVMRMIAAAPQMLDALKRADQNIKFLCDMVRVLSGNPRKVRHEDFAEEVLAAIRAAV